MASIVVRQLVLLAVLVATIGLVAVSGQPTKDIRVSLRTKWAGVPWELQAGEFVASQSNQLFWDFAHKFPVLSSDETDKSVYDKIMKVAQAELQLSAGTVQVLEMGLALDYYSPRIAAFQQVIHTFLVTNVEESIRGKVSIHSPDFACPHFAYINRKVICDIAKMDAEIASIAAETTRPVLHAFDHIYPSSAESAPVAILHSSLGSAEFGAFHAKLAAAAQAGKITYVFRPFLTNELPSDLLQGYGVELALKSVEYKVMNDQQDQGQTDAAPEAQNQDEEYFYSTRVSNHAEHVEELKMLQSSSVNVDDAFEKLTEEQLRDLDLYASQYILQSKEPLRMIQDVSQNLPTMAPLFFQNNAELPYETKTKLLRHMHIVESGQNALLINGRVVDPNHADPFTMFSFIKEESEKYEALKQFNIARQDVFDLLAIPPAPRVIPRIQLNSDAIGWINDLEKDDLYNRWPKSVTEFLRPLFPGQIHYVAKNVFNLVLVLDPTDPTLVEVAKTIVSLTFRNNAPLRSGFLILAPAAGGDKDPAPSLALGRAFQFVLARHGGRKAGFFLSSVFSRGVLESVDTVETAFLNGYGSTDDWDTTQSEAFEEKYLETKRFLRDRRITKGGIYMNGIQFEVSNAQMFTNTMVGELMNQRGDIQELINSGQLHDNLDAYGFLCDLDAYPSFSEAVFATSDNPEKFIALHSAEATAALKTVEYFSTPSQEEKVKVISQLLAVDLSTDLGTTLAAAGLERLLQEEDVLPDDVRMAFLNCEAGVSSNVDSNILIKMINTFLHVTGSDNGLGRHILGLYLDQFLRETLVDLNFAKVLEILSKQVPKDEIDAFTQYYSSPELISALRTQQSFCKTVAATVPGGLDSSHIVLANGRVVASKVALAAQDLDILERYERKLRVKTIVEKLGQIQFLGLDQDKLTPGFRSELIQKTVAVLNQPTSLKGGQIGQLPQGLEPNFVIDSVEKDSPLSVTVMIDPLSSAAQRASTLLLYLHDVLDADIRVILNPRIQLTSFPLKNFFRYVFNPISFDSTGKRHIVDTTATFANLPQRRVLSMNIHPPASWLVGAVDSIYDLDNILLASLPASEARLSARFELEHLLIEGSCGDQTNGGIPPRGLQLNLGDVSDDHQVDTLVMSNLGYYQLKSNPGVWTLQLGEGRHSEVYRIVGGSLSIPVVDFITPSYQLVVEKQPGKKDVPLFPDEGAGDAGVWSSLSGMFGDKNEDDQETIHVFSVASGHLYERFLKIMMLSVRKQTKNPVKFWFIKNFLSPKFKEFVPKFAKMYDFEVELVTYKWPAWLHHQTEKQRIIWGYKILFLDVLFPLNLKKVIFVDADQVVRADLKELWDLNLHGAPYGYTPFCQGDIMRDETKGFRFWDQGFWREHLQGRPYHISALYVIDLMRFRAVAAGDRLRATYDGLARDPNSLANLDQDLPNYMQHFVRIHSLPREWLWCETWCTDGSKAAAKTIDLCNNPLTKTPKLENAVRILPEWTGLDNEARQAEEAIARGATTLAEVAAQAPSSADEKKQDKKDEL